jgi:signal transduction histidine kinase
MRSLGSRLTYWYVLVVSATVILSLFVGRWLLERELIRGMDLLNGAEFQEIVDRVEKKGQLMPESEVLQRIAAHSKIDAPLYFFQLRDSTGEVVFRSANMGDAVLPENPAGQTNTTRSAAALDYVRIAEFKMGPMKLQIAASLRDAHRLLHSYFQVSLGMLGVAAALSVFFGYRLSRLALDPVRRIQLTAQRISAENLSERIPVDNSKDEIAALSRLLNQMFDRLEISFDRLWRFAADASHELKTPLSLIRLQSEKLLLHGQLSSSQHEAVQQQLESITRLDSVIEKLLFLAKSEVGGIKLNLRRQSTHELISAVTEDARALCEDALVEFELRETRDMEATFDAILLRQVILNLLTNALHVTPKGGYIALSSSCAAGHWRVVMEDTGPGLPIDRVCDVFEPFVRVPEEAGNETTDGAGLGLAICRSILDLHHGQIRAENRDPGPGLRVIFEIPLSRPTEQVKVA